MANAYRQQQMYAAQAAAQATPPASSSSASAAPTPSYGSYLSTPAAAPQFRGFGVAQGLGTFNPASFDAQKKEENKDQDKEKDKK
jgi:hypothetical protein